VEARLEGDRAQSRVVQGRTMRGCRENSCSSNHGSVVVSVDGGGRVSEGNVKFGASRRGVFRVLALAAFVSSDLNLRAQRDRESKLTPGLYIAEYTLLYSCLYLLSLSKNPLLCYCNLPTGQHY